MSTGRVDPTIKANVLANTVFDAVLDAAAINAYYTDIGNKIDGNYDEAHPNNIASIGLYRSGCINGSMMINQRGITSSTQIATGASAYTLDRMKSVNLGSGVSAQVFQTGVTDLNGASKGLIMLHTGSVPTAQGKLSHVYTMEALDSYKLAGQQVTFQVQANGFQGINRITLNARYKTTESAISNASTLIGTSGAVAITVGSWTLVTLTVTLPSRATLTATGVIGIEIIASKTTAEASSDGFIITQLDWNIGSTALPYQPRSYNQEYMECIRYYYRSWTDGAVSPSSGSIIGFSYVTNAIFGTFRFPITMRTTPTLVVINNNIVNQARNSSTGAPVSITAPTGLGINSKGFSGIVPSGTPFTAGQAYDYDITVDAEL